MKKSWLRVQSIIYENAFIQSLTYESNDYTPCGTFWQPQVNILTQNIKTGAGLFFGPCIKGKFSSFPRWHENIF